MNRFWTAVALLLLVVTIGSSLVVWARCSPAQPIEISLPADDNQVAAGILVGGAVANPGYYPLNGADSVEALLAAAGGATEEADLSGLELSVPEKGEGQRPQKVNLNRAETWLLEALPGIGPTRARAIVDYRERNGPFRSTDELTRVEGIGTATYEQIKDLITVAD